MTHGELLIIAIYWFTYLYIYEIWGNATYNKPDLFEKYYFI